MESAHSGTKLQCSLCDTKFGCKNNLAIHMKKKHNIGKNCKGLVKLVYEKKNEKSYDCKACEKQFKYKHNYRDHMKEVHNEDVDQRPTQGISYF